MRRVADPRDGGCVSRAEPDNQAIVHVDGCRAGSGAAPIHPSGPPHLRNRGDQMTSDTGTILGRGVWLVAAVAALLASPARPLRAGAWEGGRSSPPRVAQITKEDLRSRVPNFFAFDYQFGPSRAGGSGSG